MDSTEEVYYTESTEIIDEDGCWGMQEAVIVENENLNWQEEGPEITVGYVESTEENDQTLTESDAYLSTNAEDSVDNDKSQYYSILESTYQEDGYDENVSANIIVKVNHQDESILPDMPESDEYEVNKESNNEENLNNQVVLYHSDDPNEMYAIQIADDGSGNLQRYKYKVRQTDDGQLEAIPGTIELQDASIEEDVEKNDISEETSENLMSDNVNDDDIDPTRLLLTKEHNQEDIESENHDEVHLKEEYLSENVTKVTEENFDASESYLDDEYGTPEYLLSDDNTYGEEEETDYTMISPNEDDLGLKLQKSYQLEVNPDINYYDDDESMLNLSKRDGEEFLIENGSVKSITQSSDLVKRKFFKSKFNNSTHHEYDEYNKHLTDNKEVTVFRDDRNVSYLLVDTKEKENLSVTQIKTTFGIKNARSILKTNYIVPIEDSKKNINIKKVASIRMLNNNKGIITKEGNIVKPSDANYEEHKITEVKIAAKSVRQPRKQTIKPVERVGSEIIVQPMYYTFNNDYPELEVRKKRKYTHRTSHDVVKVSDDSDPDYTEKPKPKKKKTSIGRRLSKNKKITQIVIDSSDVSTDTESVIEVLSGEETEEDEKQTNNQEEKVDEEIAPEPVAEENDLDKSDDILKIQEAVDDIVQERKRASEKTQNEKPTETTEKSNGNNVVEKSVDKTIKKNNIKCPICPKTFPRQINLKTHMNIHSARRVLRSKSNSVTKTVNKDETKSAIIKKPVRNLNTAKKTQSFSCTKCKLKFMSENQLLRHQTIHNEKKTFIPKNASPRKHQFLRNSKNNLSPRKLHSVNKPTSNITKLTRSSALLSKISVDNKKIMSPKGLFKCEYCVKSFSQRVLLNAHRAIHKPFSCCNCTLKFSTKILLDEHLRKSCVKTAVLKQNSVRRSPVKNKITVSKTLLKCTSCNQFFSTTIKLDEHISTTHKKPVTSNKASSTKKIMTRPKRAHGGVPASARMQRAFDIMKLRS